MAATTGKSSNLLQSHDTEAISALMTLHRTSNLPELSNFHLCSKCTEKVKETPLHSQIRALSLQFSKGTKNLEILKQEIAVKTRMAKQYQTEVMVLQQEEKALLALLQGYDRMKSGLYSSRPPTLSSVPPLENGRVRKSFVHELLPGRCTHQRIQPNTSSTAPRLPCGECGSRDCPMKDPHHYERAGCPSCWAILESQGVTITVATAEEVIDSTTPSKRQKV